MSGTHDEGTAGCIAGAGMLVLEPLTWALWTWALVKVWGWYAVPLIGPSEPAYALATVAAIEATQLLTHKTTAEDDPPMSRLAAMWATKGFIGPVVVVWAAWGAGKLTGALP